MIKVIKEGTKQTITCEDCGCYFSFEEEDLKFMDYRNGTFQSGIKYGYKKYVECPQCKKKICIEQTK